MAVVRDEESVPFTFPLNKTSCLIGRQDTMMMVDGGKMDGVFQEVSKMVC